MDGRVGVPIVLLTFADVLQVAHTFLALLRELVHRAVGVLAPGQWRSVRTTTGQIAHDCLRTNAFVNTHEALAGTRTSTRRIQVVEQRADDDGGGITVSVV